MCREWSGLEDGEDDDCRLCVGNLRTSEGGCWDFVGKCLRDFSLRYLFEWKQVSYASLLGVAYAVMMGRS